MTSMSSAGSSAGALQVGFHLKSIRCCYDMHCINPLGDLIMDSMIGLMSDRLIGLMIDRMTDITIDCMADLMIDLEVDRMMGLMMVLTSDSQFLLQLVS